MSPPEDIAVVAQLHTADQFKTKLSEATPIYSLCAFESLLHRQGCTNNSYQSQLTMHTVLAKLAHVKF